MTGPEHFSEAQQLLAQGCDYGCPHAGCAHEMAYLARAQVHAALALVAATALPGEHPGDWQREIWAFGLEAGPVPEPAESGEAEDTRRLDRIRVVLAKFDWEHDDQQLALEAIERVVEGGQA
jgi:hypothetical protein